MTVRAQSATATLSGTVVDQNDSVVPDVNIAVISIAQGFQRTATTREQGTFVVPLLPPGNYIVKAERQGFTPAEVRDVVLNVNDQVAIKIHMKVGTLSQTVEIVEGGSLINESPAVATVVDRQFVANLPLNGRSFQPLIALTPGVVLTKTTVAQQGQFSVNGQRPNTNYFTVDGVSANIGASGSSVPGPSGAGALPGLSASGGTNNLVSIDALEEFRIQTSTYAPEFGRTPGAQVSIVTRAGTNQFSGSVFNYFRTEKLDANDWFANREGRPRSALRQNDFGGVLGGPIVKNRTFFFFSYEGLRLRQPQFGITDVPSLTSRQVAPAAVQPLLDAYPRPNGPETANGLARFSSGFSNPSTLNATSIRIDQTVGSKLTLFGRYNHAPSESVARGGPTQSLNTVTHYKVSTQTATFGALSLISSKINNDLRFNYSRNKAEGFFTVDDFGGAAVPANATLFPQNQSSDDGQFFLGIGSAALFLGVAPAELQRQVNIVDNISVVSGNHQLKFGGDYRRLSPVLSAPVYTQQLIFSGVGTPSSALPGTVLSGVASFVAITTQHGPQIVIFNNVSAYGQDTWKVNRRLTLTYGFRWDVNPAPHEAKGNDPLPLLQVTDPSTFAFAPHGTPLWKTTYNNVAPRIGAAYQLSQAKGRELIVRGGVGIFYDLGNGQASNAFALSFPFTASRNLFNEPFPLPPGDAAAPILGPKPTPSDFLYVFDPELILPRVYQWNFTLEQSLGTSQSLTASYVAAVGRRLLKGERLQNPGQFLGIFNIVKNRATSDYHAMQLQFQRRLARGLQAHASYTWSHSIDIASGDGAIAADVIANPQQDRGPSDFDVRHAFNGAITYNLPSSQTGSVGSKIISGWSADGIFTARTATPVNVTYNRTTTFGSASLRPDLIAGVPLYLDDPRVPGGRGFNNTAPSAAQIAAAGCAPLSSSRPAKGAFCTPPTSRQGTLGRNALRGFPVWQLDLALRRQINLTERFNLQFRAEFFNLFNHPNFADPLGSLTNSSFGVSTSMLGRSLGTGGLTGGFNPLYQVGGPRSIQLSMKLSF